MKLEKRSAGGSEPTPPIEDTGGKKPVILYLMVLLIVAFLLMALSFAMHQRSNSETLAELRNSMTAMEAMQKTQEQIADLESQLSDAGERIEALEAKASEAEVQAAGYEEELQAMEGLYVLERWYDAGEYDRCREQIELMEARGDSGHLGTEPAAEGVGSPLERWEEIRDAVNDLAAQPEDTGTAEG